MKCFNDMRFKQFFLEHGGEFKNLSFENCIFDNCAVFDGVRGGNELLFAHLEGITLKNCTSFNSMIRPTFFKNIQVNNLKTGDILLAFSAMFHHVIIQGKIGALKINKSGSSHNYNFQNKLDIIRRDFYSKIDWALDISQARFLSFNCEGIPANLIRRDSKTQFVVTRERFHSMDMLNMEFKEKYKFVSFLLELFLESGEDDQVLVTPLGKAKKYYMPILEGFQELRRIGILEPE